MIIKKRWNVSIFPHQETRKSMRKVRSWVADTPIFLAVFVRSLGMLDTARRIRWAIWARGVLYRVKIHIFKSCTFISYCPLNLLYKLHKCSSTILQNKTSSDHTIDWEENIALFDCKVIFMTLFLSFLLFSNWYEVESNFFFLRYCIVVLYYLTCDRIAVHNILTVITTL